MVFVYAPVASSTMNNGASSTGLPVSSPSINRCAAVNTLFLRALFARVKSAVPPPSILVWVTNNGISIVVSAGLSAIGSSAYPPRVASISEALAIFDCASGVLAAAFKSAESSAVAASPLAPAAGSPPLAISTSSFIPVTLFLIQLNPRPTGPCATFDPP